ncbi:unnamed protein product [Acanthoscelides obtectus]|uniref:Uncharacterized protein n=1 Tax=Acanthoscelides obtectus TaxID=200917 RepID=A0A9P0LJ47_ACAOB|nr:unnamed protein product [Acanthoscelides obtectus]CAK1622413.1 hypothetical protein AOBTE_LOCUS1468 [Acanthoscelides obtectus]
MSHYTIEKCLTMAWIVGGPSRYETQQMAAIYFVALAIGNWITIYLIISLLFYKEDTITIGDFAETFSGMSLVIHGIQRSFSLFFNRKQISEMLQYVRTTFWKESDLDMTDEEKYICKKYYNRLKSPCTCSPAHVLRIFSDFVARLFFLMRIFYLWLVISRTGCPSILFGFCRFL